MTRRTQSTAPLAGLAVVLAAVAAPTRGQEAPPVSAGSEEPDLVSPGTLVEDSSSLPFSMTDPVEVGGISELRFNPTQGTLFFTTPDRGFSRNPSDIVVLLNETPVRPTDLSISRRIVGYSYRMPPGLNQVTLRAIDEYGERVETDLLVWAGDRSLVVDVVDSFGRPLDAVRVTARLAESQAVQSSALSSEGMVVFENLPPAPVMIEASHVDGLSGTASVDEGQVAVVVQLSEPPGDDRRGERMRLP